jgi:hypothetical protein
MQRAIDDMMNQMGLGQLHFVVTADLATKISSLMWKAHPKDLSLGIHPFCIGKTSPDAIAQLQDLARKYDLISSDGASPSLTDAQELVGVGKASIPRKLISLDAQNQLFVVLLKVFFGTDHSVTCAWETHTTSTQQQLLSLQYYTARMPRHQLLLPALIQRWCQLRFSYWMERQWGSMNDLEAPDWSELWMHITLKTDWESPLPDRYLAPLTPDFPTSGSLNSGSILSGLTGTTSNSTETEQSQQRHPPAGAKQTTSQETLNVADKCVPYIELLFAPYRATGKRVREVMRAANEAGNPIPKSDSGSDICVSYHVKGICNSNCGRKLDHKPHSEGETTRLVSWCAAAFEL